MKQLRPRRVKRFWKAAAALTALLLIGIILFVSNAFIGNPVSAAIANHHIKQHMKQHYAHLDLVFDQKSKYNFKNNTYVAKLRSQTSVDTHFYVSVKKGKIENDSYAFDVLGYWNTLDRLSRAYSQQVEALLENKLGMDFRSVTVMYDQKNGDAVQGQLSLDMPFTGQLALPSELSLGAEAADLSLSVAADLLHRIHNVLSEHGYGQSRYSLFMEDEASLLMINGLTPAHFDNGDIAALLERAYEQGEHDGVIVFRKP